MNKDEICNYGKLVKEQLINKSIMANLARNVGNIEDNLKKEDKTDFVVGGQDVIYSQNAEIQSVDKTLRIENTINPKTRNEMIDFAIDTHSDIFARFIDKKIIEECFKCNCQRGIKGRNHICETELLEGVFTLNNLEGAVIIIHNSLITQVSNMENFKRAESIKYGLLGFFKDNIPIYVNDRCVDEKGDAVVIIMEKRTLGYKLQKNLDIKVIENKAIEATDINVSMLFSTRQISNNLVLLRNLK